MFEAQDDGELRQRVMETAETYGVPLGEDGFSLFCIARGGQTPLVLLKDLGPIGIDSTGHDFFRFRADLRTNIRQELLPPAGVNLRGGNGSLFDGLEPEAAAYHSRSEYQIVLLNANLISFGTGAVRQGQGRGVVDLRG